MARCYNNNAVLSAYLVFSRARENEKYNVFSNYIQIGLCNIDFLPCKDKSRGACFLGISSK